MDVIVNTGSSIIQAFYEKKGSTLKDEYRRATAVAFMDPRDMKKLDLTDDDVIDVKTKWGEVTLFVRKSHDAPHEGIIFIPKGPWANIIISPETYCCNIPTYKGISASIQKSDKPVYLVAELMHKFYNKYQIETSSDKPVYIKREDD